MSLLRFAQLLALGVLGLAGLLALGVGGVVFVQGYAFPGPRIGIRAPGFAEYVLIRPASLDRCQVAVQTSFALQALVRTLRIP